MLFVPDISTTEYVNGTGQCIDIILYSVEKNQWGQTRLIGNNFQLKSIDTSPAESMGSDSIDRQ